MAKRPLEIDMCSSSQLRDTQGEMLNVEGADIDELLAGRGRLNDNHGKGFFNCLGKVTAAKKIFKAEDCEDDRQRYYWEKVKSPYIYVKGELFDDEDHPNAKAAAAILRNIHKSDCPLKVKASVEGGVIARGIADPSYLNRTKIHSIALTFVPANQATLVEPINLNKSESDTEADMVLIKSVLHLAQTNVPSFRHITRTASAEKIENNLNKICAALGVELPFSLKQDLIKDSLQAKIEENVIRIHSLVKAEALKKMAVIHQDNEKPKTVWRVQNEQGEGPYTSKKRPEWDRPYDGDDYYERNPGPKSDLDDEDHSAYYKDSNQIDWGKLQRLKETNPQQLKELMDSGKWEVNEGYMFGFEHPDHAKAWFGDKGLKTLDAQGFKLTPVHAREVRRSKSGKQVLYLPHEPKMNKMLSAGYGGGSPLNNVGGSVLQTETMDLGPKGFKHITCDNCGKEQMYGKYQVKCRECNKGFSLAKLEKFFRINK